MTSSFRARHILPSALFALAFANVAGAQAPVSRPTPPATPRAEIPAIIQPPAPVIPPRRATSRVGSTAAAAAPIPLLTPKGSPRPDSAVRPVQRVASVPPALARPTPTRRIRDFGDVRNDVARQPAPAGATGRCKDGTYLLSAPSEDACAGKGGLSIRMTRAQIAPVPPARRP